MKIVSMPKQLCREKYIDHRGVCCALGWLAKSQGVCVAEATASDIDAAVFNGFNIPPLERAVILRANDSKRSNNERLAVFRRVCRWYGIKIVKGAPDVQETS